MALSNYSHRLLKNVHLNLPPPSPSGETVLISGDYRYYHYGCDGFDDKGWGCGYRTAQMLMSWIATQLPGRSRCEVPTIPKMQEMLVSMEDKSSSFLGSKEWIGTYEACLVMNKMFDIPSKILHVRQDEKFNLILPDLKYHFEQFMSPVMIGGDKDCTSKGVVGIHFKQGDTTAPAYLLIVDPHFVGVAKSAEELQRKGWVKWVSATKFMDSSFYNVCQLQMKFSDYDI